MIFIDELKSLKLYNKKFYLPIDNMRDKTKGNAVLLMTPNYNSTVRLLQNPLMIQKHYKSYYLEKDIFYVINHEGYIDVDKTNNLLSEIYQEEIKSIDEVNLSNPITSNVDKIIKNKNIALKKTLRKPIYRINKLGDVNKNNVGRESNKRDLNKAKIDNPNIKSDNIKINQKKDQEDVQQESTIIELEDNIYVGYSRGDKVFDENRNYIKFNTDIGNIMYILNENIKYNSQLKKLLYTDRMRNNQDIFGIYDMVKQDIPYINYTYLTLDKYQRRNVFIDTFYYNEIFLNKNIWKRDKGIDLYFDLLDRFIDNNKLEENGYKFNTILVPVLDWCENDDSLDYSKNINFLSMILRLLKQPNIRGNLLERWSGLNFVFITDKGYFKCDFGQLLQSKSDRTKFGILLSKLISGETITDEDNERAESKKAVIMGVIDKIEDEGKIKLSKATGDSKEKEISKDQVIDKIEKAAEISSSPDDVINKLDDDERLKKILIDLQQDEEDKVKLSNARASRMMKAQDKSMENKIKGTTVREILKQAENTEVRELPVTELHIDSINDDWKHMQYMNFEEMYNVDEDILKALYSLSEKSDPIAIVNIDIQDTSTSEDLKETYTVKMEDARGQRFTIKFDVPKFVDNKFMKLRGNEKTMNGQLTLIPIIKTDEDTVQIVSNYKKIFVYRYGASIGKSYPDADKVYKCLNKYDGNKIKIRPGDNTKICSKYELPMDYIDLARAYNTIETPTYIYYFNQDEIREKYKDIIDLNKGLPIGYNKNSKTIHYFGLVKDYAFSSELLTELCIADQKFADINQSTKYANKYAYSRANILNSKIPIILIMAHSEGLETSMKKANIRYEITEKKPKKQGLTDYIKFKDAYIEYSVDYNSSLLMNGIKEFPTENYSITEINNKSMYLDFLDLCGGRLLSDGLDNFYDLMIDPITKEVLERYELPTDYCEILAYANFLLSDNKYSKHVDITSRRYRSNELVAGYTYQAIAEAYGSYKTELKKRGSATMTMKQSVVIDKVMLDPTCADLSSLNDLQNAEAIGAVSCKGLAGMNFDRSYDLEKRAYDESMLNVLAMATGFAGNVGVTRQATMDMNIEGKRGYIKTIDGDSDKLSISKSFCPTEGMTPFGATRDDPFRSAMNFVQTSKHGMRVKHGDPLLISNGTDMALPYMTSNTFSFNAKADGKVIEVTEDYIIVEYTNGDLKGTKDFIDLRNNIRKNSNGGFYQAIKLDSDLKVGNRFKKSDILAYDRLSYTDIVGSTDDISYKIGTLCKVALLTTDEGFEDSAIISEWLSDAMASRVVIKKEYVLPKNTNIYYMVKKGQAIEEGEPLMIFQNAFDDEDVNILLKNLSDDEEIISDLGRIPIKSKYTGRIEDIKIYRTVEKSELSDSLRKEVDKIEKPINAIKKTMEANDIYDPSKIEPTYVLEKTGKLKNVDEGVLIEFYISYYDLMSIGDKLIYSAACKGTVKDIFPEGKEPYGLFRPDEKIHSLVPYFGIANRIVCSIINTIPINKVLIELDRAVKDLCDIPYKYLDEE